VLEPANTLTALEQSAWPYHRYFVHKWMRSLRRKQDVWKDAHDFSAIGKMGDLRRMTAALVSRYTDYPDIQAYLSGYALTGDRLQTLRAPAVILTSEDDPIIPVADIHKLARPDCLRIVVTARGGHMGFMVHPLAPSWLNGFVRASLRIE
jgi:predicted alpha/beta-fold hydrolase